MCAKERCLGFFLVLAASASAWGSATISQAIDDGAGYLVSSQEGDGSWAGAEALTGPIVSGLVNAYAVKGNASYKAAADAGGNYILDLSGYGQSGFSLTGEESYSLARLSEIAGDPASNTWRTVVSDFHQLLNSYAYTSTFIAGIRSGYPDDVDSLPLFDLAHHTLAAYYVDASDKGIFRQAVIDTLADVTSDDWYPVMSLGAAVSALAVTGDGLDSTVISTSGYWAGVQLDDLPGILAGHQAVGGSYPDSFYWRFDHTGNPAAGLTEDTVFGTLGLLAAGADARWDYGPEVLAARRVLTNGDNYGFASPDYGVMADGAAYNHIWDGGLYGPGDQYVYVGETLQALPEPGTMAILVLGSVLLARGRSKRRRLCGGRAR